MALAIALIAAACSDSGSRWHTGAGAIAPEVTVDPDVEASGITGGVIISNVPPADSLRLRITSADGAYTHTWVMAEYDPAAPVAPGAYTVEAFYGDPLTDAFDSPYFYGSAQTVVEEGATARPAIECTLANTMFAVTIEPEVQQLAGPCTLTLHSSGGGYVTFSPGEERRAFLRPGSITVSATCTHAGRPFSFDITTIPQAKAAYCYRLALSAATAADGVTELTLSADERISSDDVTLRLTPEFIDAPAPELTCSGFVSDAPLHIDEGIAPAEPLTVNAAPAARVQRLMLTVTAPTLLAAGWPAEADLLSCPAHELEAMKACGLLIDSTPEAISVDFSRAVSRLSVAGGDERCSFALRAVSRLGRASEPAVLRVSLAPVDVELLSVTPATVGVDVAAITVRCPEASAAALLGVQLLGAAGEWTAVAVELAEPLELPGEYALRFRLPAGTAPVRARLIYQERPRAEFLVGRVPPEFTIEADPYALKADLRVITADPDLRATVTSMAAVYADGSPLTAITRRPDQGIITVSGLRAATTYTLQATVMESPTPAQLTPAITVTTERAEALPNGDFEEVEKSIDYSRLPCGGRYSQNIVEIYNQQNYRSFRLEAPAKWANVNAKTFCTAAARHNTWYMQPSTRTVGADEAFSGSYAVRLDCTGWDLDGPDIPPYLQQSQPYTDYSRNVPAVACRAAGKIFLGSYTFDPLTATERYDEGIDFTSRPSALNGYYRLTPVTAGSQDQTALALVEVIGMADGLPVVIASGRAELQAAPGYTAFTVPLTYTRFGIKAVRVKVMLAASATAGTIAQETLSTVTVPLLPEARMAGNTLWLDALSFSY